MEVIVKKKFVDKYTGQTRNPGDKLIITDVRFREIQRSGDFVERVKVEDKK